MIRSHYDVEHEAFRTPFRTLLDRAVVPNRARYKRDGMIDRQVYSKAGEQGFLCYWVDEKYGGLSLQDYRYDQIMEEENARSLARIEHVDGCAEPQLAALHREIRQRGAKTVLSA